MQAFAYYPSFIYREERPQWVEETLKHTQKSNRTSLLDILTQESLLIMIPLQETQHHYYQVHKQY